MQNTVHVGILSILGIHSSTQFKVQQNTVDAVYFLVVKIEIKRLLALCSMYVRLTFMVSGGSVVRALVLLRVYHAKLQRCCAV